MIYHASFVKTFCCLQIFHKNVKVIETWFDDFCPVFLNMEQKHDWSWPFFKILRYFLWREQLYPAIHCFKCTWFFWRIRLSHPFFHLKWFISGSSCSRVVFQSFYGTAIFDTSYLLRAATFSRRAFLFISFFKGSMLI